jgi:DsbC/DsbD-like thiol-disulfide interchange protein/cytochrome c biogenesis protein CcdA
MTLDMLKRLILLLALLLAPALAQARGIEPQLVAEGPAPAGGSVDLAIAMHPAPGWHGYWLNPGDAGLPMQVQWTLPKGVSVGQLRYPVPSQLKIAGLMNYVYQSDYAVLTALKVPADAKGTIPIRAEAHWLACTDRICVPESGELSLDVPVGTGTPNRAQFDQWRQALPRPLAAVAHFEIAGNRFRVGIPLPSDIKVDRPYLFPETDGPVDYAGEQQFSRDDDVLIADLPYKEGQPTKFSGVLALGNGGGLEFQAVPGPVPSGTPLGGSAALGSGALLWAVLGAIAGGILLNLMPCVFPILALKALHLARTGGEAGHARRDSLAYAAGAIVGTGALGVALLAIRAGGTAAGWAFQLQEPRTVLLLLLLATAITLNLTGAFELPAVGGSARPAGSFGTGALAAFVATPCAGPFLGAALGTALLLPLAGSVLVFGALGLGLAIPFVVIAFVPPLRNRLPRPGGWMKRLQRFLAIPMGASAVAALWLLSREAGHEGMIIGLTAAILIAVALVLIGLSQRRGGPLPITSLVLVAVALVGTVAFAPEPRAQASTENAAKWSEAAVQDQLKQGHPAFVYFTADWCLSCKVNEAAAINRSEVRSAFNKAGVKVFAGDWTGGDPVITRFLESQGRAGVPLYLWYQPGKPPEQLPQVLTPAMLIERAQRNG